MSWNGQVPKTCRPRAKSKATSPMLKNRWPAEPLGACCATLRKMQGRVFNSLADIPPLPIWAGVLARAVEGRDVMFAVVELDANSAVAQHQHPNEQIGIILKGSLRF